MKKILTTVFLSLTVLLVFAQAPQSFKYQTVIRDGSGVVLSNRIVGIRTSIIQGSPTGSEVYSEKHNVTSNDFGVVTLNIGQGDILAGNFSHINWANGPYFIKVELDITGGNNYLFMGTSEMLSVPYALYAERSNISNADTSATNELQTLTRNGLDITLSQGGGTVNIADNDNDSTNELQQISKTGNVINLSRNGGSVTDSDNQMLSLQGNQLQISNGNSVVITGVVDLDADPTNEIQQISKSGKTISLSRSGGSINLIDDDTTNELQLLSYQNDTLRLSKGNFVVIPAFPIANTTGEMLFWNGTDWVIIPAGIYGQTLVFCNGVPSWTGCVPILTTTMITGIANDVAFSGGFITNDGGRLVIARGVCWSISHSPTIANDHSTDGYDTGGFTSNIIGLTTATTYYVRAYATNSAGTSYGNEFSFTTLTLAPTLTTTAISSITGGAAVSGGNITNDGGATVISRGVCWSTNTNPTIANNHTSDGSGIGTFVSNITGLAISTTYFVRAYATNSIGITYGNERSFTSSQAIIGQSYQGGIIAYVLQSGDPGYIANVQHGLIAAPTDQSIGAQWGCYGTAFGIYATSLGTGQSNTTAIVNSCGTSGIAARLCNNLVLNGYSDWYLPSQDELTKLYLNRVAIGGFTIDNNYWSSTEFSLNLSYYQTFSTSLSYGYGYKYSTYNVRAIRAF